MNVSRTILNRLEHNFQDNILEFIQMQDHPGNSAGKLNRYFQVTVDDVVTVVMSPFRNRFQILNYLCEMLT